MAFQRALAIAAERAAEERSISEEKRRLFVQGAEWAIEQLWRTIEVSCYEGSTPDAYLETLRAKDFRKVMTSFAEQLKVKQ